MVQNSFFPVTEEIISIINLNKSAPVHVVKGLYNIYLLVDFKKKQIFLFSAHTQIRAHIISRLKIKIYPYFGIY